MSIEKYRKKSSELQATQDNLDSIYIPQFQFRTVPKKSFSSGESSANVQDLQEILKQILVLGKNILNCGESVELGNRMIRHGKHNTEENRRKLTNALFTTQDIDQYVSLVILANEALFQKTPDNILFRTFLSSRNILIGVEVDKGTVPIHSNSELECVCQGLDDLDKRCAGYKKAGCVAAKFTAVFKVGATTPSQRAILDNVHNLARFASVCQTHCLVPIICCELSIEDYCDTYQTQNAIELILAALVKALTDHAVWIETTIIAPNMTLPGKNFAPEVPHQLIAQACVTSIRRTIPPALAGIAFLTTGQDLEECSVNFDSIVRLEMCKPWPVTCIIGDSLLENVITIWAENDTVETAQNELLTWCTTYSLAAKGAFYSIVHGSQIELEDSNTS